MNFYQGPLKSRWVQIGISGTVASKSHDTLRHVTQVSRRCGMRRGTCVVAIPNGIPAVKCEGHWKGGGRMLGKRSSLLD